MFSIHETAVKQHQRFSYNDHSLYISKPDKGNGVVILNRVDYVTKVENILYDHTKFEKINNCNE